MKIQGRLILTLLAAAVVVCGAALPVRAADRNWELLFGEKLDKTEGIAACPNGRLFVAENERGAVYEILSDTEIAVVAEGLARPAGMACSQDNTLYVLLYADGMAVSLTFGEDGVEQKTVSDKLKTPNAAIVVSDGTVYISETDNGRVVILKDGAPEELVGGIPYANGLALSDDETMLYINSTTGGKVYVTPLIGENKGKKKTIAKAIQMVDGIVRAADGTLYVASYAKGDIVAIDADGNTTVVASGLTSPASPTIWNGALYVTSLNGNGVYKVAIDGE